MRCPPSPALSACDSLDGIDLDAFLEEQGSLSHFPTPPLKKTPIVQAVELVDEGLDPDDALIRNYAHIATVLAEQARIDIECTPDDIDSVRKIIVRADLPLEIICVGFNILTALHARVSGLGSFNDTPPDLLVVAALGLATSYNHDHPPQTLWWSRRVCDCTWTVKRIDKAMLNVFAALDFQIHQHSNYDNIRQTIRRLSGPSDPEPVPFDAQTMMNCKPSTKENRPLRLLIDNAASGYWNHGQLTPEATPPSSAHPNDLGFRMPLMRFLPLL